MELLIGLLLVGVAALAVPRGRVRLAAMGGIVLGAVILAVIRPAPSADLARYLPDDATAPDDARFSSSRACRACHADAYESWHRSHHRQMTQAVGPETVLAPFDGRVLVDGPRTYRVFRKGDGFFVDMPRYGTNGETPDQRMVRPVVMSTGSHHMQAYWIPSPHVDEPPARVGRALFNDRCTGCHGTDGRSKGEVEALRDAMLLPYEIERALDEPAHAQLDRRDPQGLAEIVRFVTRIQTTGRLMQFPFVWLVRHQRWVNEEHTFLQPPYTPAAAEIWGDPWSDGCDQCHSVRPDYDWSADDQRGEAEVAELGIACEACHGPGRGHIALHRDPAARYRSHLAADPPPTDDIVQPADLDHRRASAVCGQCHAELVVHDPETRFEPGIALEAHGGVVQFTPENPPPWLAPILEDEPNLLIDAFWTDGTIRIAGRNYNAQALTGCFTRGQMSCLTCHSMHDGPPNDQLKGPAVDDRPCLDCHPVIGADVTAHTHHPAESSGSRCYNCHMPHTTVGLLTLMRSHRVDSPSAERTAWSGRPDACSLCHIDRTLAETSKTLTEWYGQPDLPPTADDLGASAVVAWALRGDAVQRATAAWHMGWGPALEAAGSDWQVPYLAILLDDPYAAVRAIAIDALRRHRGFADFEYDYVAPSAARQARGEAAIARWHSAGPPPDRPTAFIVDGQLDRSRIEILFERRDDTEVRVNE